MNKIPAFKKLLLIMHNFAFMHFGKIIKFMKIDGYVIKIRPEGEIRL